MRLEIGIIENGGENPHLGDVKNVHRHEPFQGHQGGTQSLRGFVGCTSVASRRGQGIPGISLAGEPKPLTLGHPEFEGFEFIQTIETTHPSA